MPDRREALLAYWTAHLEGVPHLLELPADRPRPAVRTYAGAREPVELASGLADRLLLLARDEGVALITVLLAGLAVVVRKSSGQEDFVICSPSVAANPGAVGDPQARDAAQRAVVPLRADLTGDPTVRELLSRLDQTLRGAREHQGLALDELIEELGLRSDASTTPLAQVRLALPDAAQAAQPAQARPRGAGDAATAHGDLEFAFTESARGLLGEVVYSTDLYERATICRLIGHLETVLGALASDAAARVSAVPMLTEAERHQILVEWNDVARPYPSACLFRIFEERATDAAGNVALVCGTDRVTYGELNARANQLAHYLSARGAGVGTLVGVFADRGIEAVVAMLGTLKAGGAYVPFDTSYPADRLSFMIEDTRAPVVLTLAHLADRLPPSGATVVRLDADWAEISRHSNANLDHVMSADELACVMYTSGSTGRLKGVMIEHRGIVNLLTAGTYARFGPDRTFLQFVPLSFDVANFEIWGALLHGARLVIAPPGLVDLGLLARIVADEHVTTLWLTSPLFHEIVDHHAEKISGVDQLLTGGDVVSLAHFSRMLALPGRRMVTNCYGPTETTTYSCTYAERSDQHATAQARYRFPAGRLPVGRPIANTKVYILDEHATPVPVGVEGDLWIGGAGVARGYLNRPEITAERFVPDPFDAAPGARMYRTGDRARYLANGNIDFLGRSDHQLKIRGIRIEPGEIEAALTLHPLIRESVVVASGEGNLKRLIAYFSANSDSSPPSSELKDYLAALMPAHMIPTAFVCLSALPLTPNGKVDRTALAAAGLERPEPGQQDATPPTETEMRIAAMWRKVLQIEQVAAGDNFFELGGDSLLALRLLSLMSYEFRTNIGVRTLYDHPTIAELGQWVDSSTSQ